MKAPGRGRGPWKIPGKTSVDSEQVGLVFSMFLTELSSSNRVRSYTQEIREEV